MLLTIFLGKRSSNISFQTSPEVRHQFRRKLHQLHSGNRWCLITDRGKQPIKVRIQGQTQPIEQLELVKAPSAQFMLHARALFNPGERHSRVTWDDGMVMLCTLRVATVLSPSRTNVVPLTAVRNTPPSVTPPPPSVKVPNTHQALGSFCLATEPSDKPHLALLYKACRVGSPSAIYPGILLARNPETGLNKVFRGLQLRDHREARESGKSLEKTARFWGKLWRRPRKTFSRLLSQTLGGVAVLEAFF